MRKEDRLNELTKGAKASQAANEWANIGRLTGTDVTVTVERHVSNESGRWDESASSTAPTVDISLYEVQSDGTFEETRKYRGHGERSSELHASSASSATGGYHDTTNGSGPCTDCSDPNRPWFSLWVRPHKGIYYVGMADHTIEVTTEWTDSVGNSGTYVSERLIGHYAPESTWSNEANWHPLPGLLVERQSIHYGSEGEGFGLTTAQFTLRPHTSTLQVSVDRERVCPNQNVTFTARDESGALVTVNWSGGGNPATGTGSQFTTRFPNHGQQTVNARTTTGASSAKTITVLELSGPAWVQRFPQSTSTADLQEPFRANVEAFIDALEDAGANVAIATTFRPAERAHLMFYASRIARGLTDPANVPEVDPPNAINPVQEQRVDICWQHHDDNGDPDDHASRDAARRMVRAYRIRFPPAHPSRHEIGNAIDMSITWQGTLTIREANGNLRTITSRPRTGEGNHELWDVGRTYGVIKLQADPPHWSDNGR